MKNKNTIALGIIFIIWVLLVPGIQTIGYISESYFSAFDYWDFPILLSGLAFFPSMAIGPSASYGMFIVPFFAQWIILFFIFNFWIKKFHSKKSLVSMYILFACFIIATGWFNYQMLDFIDKA